jgi:hypothetical protein
MTNAKPRLALCFWNTLYFGFSYINKAKASTQDYLHFTEWHAVSLLLLYANH